MDRRELMKVAAVAAGAVTFDQSLFAKVAENGTWQFRLAHDPRRPQFHLLPKRCWMNDPNGPIYWKSQYHMFFQFNPHAPVWGDMHWGHAVSPDMVHWKHLPVALSPTPGGPDAAGCFTGSAVSDGHSVAVIYTGVVKATAAEATVNDGKHLFRESQCLATSDEPDLKTWKKVPSPVIPSPPVGLHVTGFRDPSPWRVGGGWYLAVGSGIDHQGGEVLLYRSGNLRDWEYLHALASGRGTAAREANPVANGDMWECPDFFALGNKHVLIYSSMGKVHWQVGVLDRKAMSFHPERTGIVDHGAYYAAKSQTDESGRRILWAWVPEQRSEAEYRTAGWAGLMSLPRVITLTGNNELRMEVASEVAQLRRDERKLKPGGSITGQLRSLRIRESTGELLAMVARGGQAWSFHLRRKLPYGPMREPIITIAYDPGKPDRLQVNGKGLVLPDTDTLLEIHAYLDGSVAEVLLQKVASYTQRFYYPGTRAPDVSVAFDGSPEALRSLTMWQIAPISSDRLTT